MYPVVYAKQVRKETLVCQFNYGVLFFFLFFNFTTQNHIAIGLRSHEPHHHTTVCSVRNQTFFFFFLCPCLLNSTKLLWLRRTKLFESEREREEAVLSASKPITTAVSKTPSLSLFSFHHCYFLTLWLCFYMPFFFQNPIIHSVMCLIIYLIWIIKI